MLKYLIITLDDTSTSYCHCDNSSVIPKLMDLGLLRKAVCFAMKENLSVQIVYPDYVIPMEYKEVIDTIEHYDIVSSFCEDVELREHSDVIVLHDWTTMDLYTFVKDGVYVLRTCLQDFFDRYMFLKRVLQETRRLNVIFTDVQNFCDNDIDRYRNALSSLSDMIVENYDKGNFVQLNLLTDRLTLSSMRNCNAGVNSITIAPDGNFYVCPAFYYAGINEDYGIGKSKTNIGNLHTGLKILNAQLYNIENAHLCSLCDAYHCRRCVWLNREMTYEVNTPSHEQCVMAHLERNQSRTLMERLRTKGFCFDQEIKSIDYLDPFVIRREW